MTEIKFSCPQCSQHILCDTNYAGAQINCPTCQQLIAVPPAPQAAAIKLPVNQLKPKKSRNVLVVAALVIGLTGLAGGWFGYAKFKAAQAGKNGNAAVPIPKPSVAAASAALDILAKVHQAYTNLTGLEVSGTSVGVMDISGITAADLNPNQSERDKKATIAAANLARDVTNKTEITIRLARPDLYRIEAVSKMAVGQMASFNFTIAVWFAGQTNFALLGQNFMTVPDRQSAIMKTAAAGRLVSTIPQLFFDEPDALVFFNDLGQTEDDSVNGQVCCTLTGKTMGQKLKFWVSKESYLILKSEITVGDPISDAEIETAFDQLQANSSYAPAQIEAMKIQEKQKATLMKKIRGTITEIYDDVQTNPRRPAGDFNYPVPRGVRLTAGGLNSRSTKIIVEPH
jgi:hypothetical protein